MTEQRVDSTASSHQVEIHGQDIPYMCELERFTGTSSARDEGE